MERQRIQAQYDRLYAQGCEDGYAKRGRKSEAPAYLIGYRFARGCRRRKDHIDNHKRMEPYEARKVRFQG